MVSPAFEDIVETFDFLDNWEDRYRHIIDLGKAMPPMDPALQNPTTKVDGCASQVWIMPLSREQSGEQVFDFQGDSDALIVRGLIAVLHALYSGQTPSAISAIDAVAELSRLGLADHLSAQRSNGLHAMIRRIRELVA